VHAEARRTQSKIPELDLRYLRVSAVELSYVGNRGAWWQANGLVDYKGLTEQRLASFGLNLNNAADRQLLISPLNSTLAAQRGWAEQISLRLLPPICQRSRDQLHLVRLG
jgi:hypothetical protein